MTDAEARAILVATLDKTSHSLDSSTLHDRLRNPTADFAMDELELDSLDIVEWTIEIEKACNVSLDSADLAAAASLSDAVGILRRRAEQLG